MGIEEFDNAEIKMYVKGTETEEGQPFVCKIDNLKITIDSISMLEKGGYA